MQFNINFSEGKKFAKKSGDNNAIHLEDKEGYNSLFGEKICHGCLVLIKFLKRLNLENIIRNRNKYSFRIVFFKHFSYSKNIYVLKKKNLFLFYQSNQIIAEFEIKFSDKKFYKNSIKKKRTKINIKKEKKNNDLSLIIEKLTMFVGKIYPGKNSIIREININFNQSNNFNNEQIEIYSKKLDARFPIINNELLFKNYYVNFQTLERPVFLPGSKKLNKIFQNKINNVTENVLIIGASSGIGNELLNIFKPNKKIFIFASYFKNQILIKQKNIKPFKFDLKKDPKKLYKIINKFKKIKVYYCATPKINLDAKDINTCNLYKKFYLDFPLRLLSSYIGTKMQFFYPSTTYIDTVISNYSKIKKNAEIKLNMINKKNIDISILRIQEINTKQNLSIFKKKLPSFTELLNKDKDYQNKILFKN